MILRVDGFFWGESLQHPRKKKNHSSLGIFVGFDLPRVLDFCVDVVFLFGTRVG